LSIDNHLSSDFAVRSFDVSRIRAVLAPRMTENGNLKQAVTLAKTPYRGRFL
jgi:hypothetical protein